MTASSTKQRDPRLPEGIGTLGTYRSAALAVEVFSLVILMKLLGPTPFGLVAMAEGLLLIFSAIGDAGVGGALVSDRNITRGRVAAATAIALGAGVTISLLCLAATPLVEAYYQNPSVALPWIALSILWSVNFLPGVPQAILQINGRFRHLGQIHLATAIVAAIAAIAAAFQLPGVWALIIRRCILVIGSLVLLFAAAQIRWARPTRDDLRSVIGYSSGIVGFNALNAIARNADNLLVGRFLGEAALGSYSLAYRILFLPLSQMTGLLGTVALPHLAALMPSRLHVAHSLAELMAATMRIATPALVGLALISPYLLHRFLGVLWIDAADPMRILALLAIYQTPFALSGLLFMVTRQTVRLFRWALFSTPLVVVSFAIGLPAGITGVALSYACVSLLLAPLLIVVMSRTCAVSPRVFLEPIARASVTAALASIPAISVFLVSRLLNLHGDLTILMTAVAALLATGWSIGREYLKLRPKHVEREEDGSAPGDS